MSKLAINGGAKARVDAFHAWPICDNEAKEELNKVFDSGNWWRFAFGKGVELDESSAGEDSQVISFQNSFARYHDCKYGIAAANGTGTLEMGLRAMDLNVGDEIIVPAYTYIASATLVWPHETSPGTCYNRLVFERSMEWVRSVVRKRK